MKLKIEILLLLLAAQILFVSSSANNKSVADTIAALPKGSILAWSPVSHVGKENKIVRKIPKGWQICNGNNGTPNLTDKFLMGVADSKTAGQFSGSNTINNQGTHTHTGKTNDYSPMGSQRIPCSGSCISRGSNRHSHQLNTRNNGNHNHGGDNRPAFYTVVYICLV